MGMRGMSTFGSGDQYYNRKVIVVMFVVCEREKITVQIQTV